jgi:dethiobiotin synthetase
MSGGTPRGFIVAGTDTGIGKTVFSAGLVRALDGCYWKPVQAGLDEETDSAAVRRLGKLTADRILPSAYELKMPASPHIAAAAEGIDIRQRQLALPVVARPLIVEPAGGLLVPMSPRLLQIDLIAHWGLPVILCARTALGTINHSLLSLEAMRRRRIPVHGIAFIGNMEPEVEATIARLGHVQRLGRLPHLPKLDARSLATAFATGFDIADFQG